MVFVFLYMWFHLNSAFLSFVGVTLILFSYPATLVITEGIFKATYLGSLQLISIYLVLGIAADDIFVFVDAWRQSAHVAPEVFEGNKKKRMAYAFRRAVRAMAVTSSTTSVAFFANIFSPVMPIRSFGVISGVIIPINYLFVVMFMPGAVIYYEEKFEKFTFCCCGRKEIPKFDMNSSGGGKQLTKIERFFDGPVNSFIKNSKVVLLILTGIWTIFAISQAVQMGP
mmetsp:Transcript_26882/g.40975  ORF Transcript_26882/g.40975 Transcript_26882/m.40975 type:complete len:226 (-) Transcript_26882:871-1548(-)